MWAPLAGGAVACCALVVCVALLRPASPIATDTEAVASAPVAVGALENAEDVPVIASNQMEMVQDLDFYRWLATQPAMATAAPAGSGR